MDKPKIMVVDDSESSRDTLSGFFTEIGCDVVCEESGEGAWMALNAGQKVDLLILDWHMPMGMSGPALNRKILADARFNKIPVVAFTSKLDETLDTPEAKDWIASYRGNESTLKIREHHEVAKVDGESDARRVPPELVLNVAERLREIGRALPPTFMEAVGSLKSQGFAA